MTFGCSFTKYHWPTWADIVLKQADMAYMETDNWGCPGVGNLFIAIQIQYAIASGLLKQGDHAFICWSSFAREDRLVDGRWLPVGNIFNQDMYPDYWVGKYADVEFYALRDCALIAATRSALAGLGITQTNFNMNLSEPYHSGSDPMWDRADRAIKTFKPQFDCKSMVEVLKYPPPVTVKVHWTQSDPKAIYTDTHHHPISMLNYVKQELCPLGIPWLTDIRPEVEAWVYEWDNKIKTAPQPLLYADFPLPQSKNPQWGFQ